MAIKLRNRSISSQFNRSNGGIHRCAAACLRAIVHGRQGAPPRRGRRGSVRRQVLLLNGSSMPVSRVFYTCDDCSLRCTRRQVPCVLPYSSRISRVQEQVLVDSNPRDVRPDSNLKSTPRLNPRAKHMNSSLSVDFTLRNLLGSNSMKNIALNPRANHVDSSLSVDFILRNMVGSNSKVKNIALKPRANHANSSLAVDSIHRNILGSNSKVKTTDVCDKKLHMQVRGFHGVSSSGGDSEGEGVEGDECEPMKPMADEKEVERVCNVIEELFAVDRNMEAVLDECGVELTCDLVVNVLERFRHARRPAFRFFCWAGQRSGFSHDSRTYNSMMRILGKTKQFETMVSLLDEMGEKRLLTLETFQICIKAFAAAQQRRKAVGIFELMKKYNFKVGVDSINCLLDNLGRAKLGKEAQILFEKLQGRFTPNIQTYTVLLYGWCKVGNLLEAGKVWNEMTDKGIKPDIVAHNTMLEGLLKVHKRSDAVKLFEVMKAKGPLPNVRSYTILIRDLCKQKRMKEAIECYDEMLGSGCLPDSAVYTCLITGFGNQKQMDKVYGLLKEMKERGCPPDGRMYNALIKLMTNRRMPDDAVRIYKKMVQNGVTPTIHTYNMMMKSFFITENYDMGVAVWEEMSQKGVCPDDNSYVVFIGGLIKQGRSVEACKYLEQMIGKGMKPPPLDYNKFAADFSRAGKPNILDELAQRMRLEGKHEASDVFSRFAETTSKNGKRVNFIRN